MKLAAHRHDRLSLPVESLRPQREFVVAAPRRREVFEVVLGVPPVEPILIVLRKLQMRETVEVDACPGIPGRDDVDKILAVAIDGICPEAQGVLTPRSINALTLHAGKTPLAVARNLREIDVVPEAVHLVAVTDLDGLRPDELMVTAARTEVLPLIGRLWVIGTCSILPGMSRRVALLRARAGGRNFA